jgi:beta-phosphoglucomutase-like phosphatase (HAD superfamily)
LRHHLTDIGAVFFDFGCTLTYVSPPVFESWLKLLEDLGVDVEMGTPEGFSAGHGLPQD